MEIWQSILFLLLGWLFGLLSPIIIDEIRRRRSLKQAKIAILSELTEVHFKLASTAYIIAKSFGKWDRKFLIWLKAIMDSYTGQYADQGINKHINELLALSDKELAKTAKLAKAHAFKALALKEFQTPVLDTQIRTLSMFSSDLQNLLIEIKAQVGLLNQHIELSHFYFQKTFDSGLSPLNYKIIDKNLKDAYIQACEKIKDIADLITRYSDQSRK
jgi:hypothetical protein